MKRIASLIASLVVVVAGPSAAYACGALLSDDGAAELRSFQVLMSHSSGREDLLVAIGYEDPSPGDGLAWLMPFPTPPEVSEGSDEGLDAALAITAPPLRSEHVPSVVPLVCACGAEDTETATGGAALLGREFVGDLELVTLRADSLEELTSWLDRHGFGYHDTQREVIDDYIATGSAFVAARVRPGVEAEDARLTPVHFRFETEEPVYPLAMLGSNHSEPVRMTIMTVTPQRPELTTYDARVVAPDDDGYFGDPEGIELRYSDRLSSGSAARLNPSVAASEGMWLSRFEASLDPRELDTDAVFAAADTQTALGYDEVIESYRWDRYLAYGGQVLVSFVIVTPVVLFIAGLIVVIAGIARGGFRGRS